MSLYLARWLKVNIYVFSSRVPRPCVYVSVDIVSGEVFICNDK